MSPQKKVGEKIWTHKWEGILLVGKKSNGGNLCGGFSVGKNGWKLITGNLAQWRILVRMNKGG